MSERPLQDLIARLERERRDADKRYHAALTALDAAVRALPQDAPPAPPPGDASQLPYIKDRCQDLRRTLNEDAVPAGLSIAGRLRLLIWRTISPALREQQAVNTTVLDHLERAAASYDRLAETVGALGASMTADRQAAMRLHTDLVLYLQTITEYIDTKDRALCGPELRDQIVLASERTMGLKRELDALRTQAVDAAPAVPGSASDSGAPPATPGTSDFAYVGFQDRFRGSEREIRARVEDYVPLFAGATLPVLDVGCGRGELLALLTEAGIAARGIDLNAEMAALCVERGFDARQADAAGYLESLPDASLGGLTAIQVVEHLDPPYLARFLEAAFHKLAPGAPMVLETINPACWMAFFEAYLRDLTHAQPVHADVLRFLAQASGFSSVDIQFRSPVRDSDRLAMAAGHDAAGSPALQQAIATLNTNAEKLNARLFGFMDYALIARR